MNVQWVWLGFVTIIGACVGSFLNVVAYRMPLGQSIVSPPSACPRCGHRLAWYDNVPVVGWIALRGRCRYCRTPISPQYPIVEAVCAALFGVWFYVCYFSDLRPDFAGPGLAATVPFFAVSLLLIAGLVASTLVDAKHFIIPLEVPWFVAAAAIIVLPLTVVTQFDATIPVLVPASHTSGGLTLLPHERLNQVRPIYRGSADVIFAANHPSIEPQQVLITAAPWADSRGVTASIGGALGLVLSVVLLKLGVLKHSFVEEHAEGDEEDELPVNPSGLSQLSMLLAPIGLAIGLALAADRSMLREPLWWLAVSIVAGYAAVWVIAPLVRMVRRVEPVEVKGEEGPVFPPHAHPRREVLKEIAFLLPPVVGACLGGALSRLVDPQGQPGLHVLGGVLMGLLIGGGAVWGVRILGTLGFGREAMGLGDAHLMAAVGAVAGWQVAVIAFVGAAFLGVGHAVTTRGLSKVLKLYGGEIPYGPHLAAATFIVMVWREPLLAKLTAIFYLPI